jgi:hypothetical protein
MSVIVVPAAKSSACSSQIFAYTDIFGLRKLKGIPCPRGIASFWLGIFDASKIGHNPGTKLQ